MKNQFSTPETERDFKKFKEAVDKDRKLKTKTTDKKHRMKTLDDLGLCKKSRKIVEDWLQEWLDLFIKQANNKHAWVYRANFEENDFFYFTDCKDILKKDPEAKGQENNLAIRSRKRKIMMQLFLKTLLNQNLGLITITCNHCAYRGCWIEALKDGNGHWVYCPKCKKTDIHVFPGGYDNCMNTIRLEIAKKIAASPSPVFATVPTPLLDGTHHLKVDPKCKKLIKEIRDYKYKCDKCDKCGASSKKVPFDYAVGLCNDCYYKECEGKK